MIRRPMQFTFEPIGIIRSCYQQKFGIPRQAGLVRDAGAVLELVPSFNRLQALEGLEGFSHIWIVFVFHQNLNQAPKTTVRPPRLGGNRRMGVFATRSGFRPNPIGLSAVELVGIRCEAQKIRLDIKGVDLLDETPVLDIKPYLPYADSIDSASGGFAARAPTGQLSVKFTPDALLACRQLQEKTGQPVKTVIARSLCYDPRPAYYDEQTKRQFATIMFGAEIKWRIQSGEAIVESIAIC